MLCKFTYLLTYIICSAVIVREDYQNCMFSAVANLYPRKFPVVHNHKHTMSRSLRCRPAVVCGHICEAEKCVSLMKR